MYMGIEGKLTSSVAVYTANDCYIAPWSIYSSRASSPIKPLYYFNLAHPTPPFPLSYPCNPFTAAFVLFYSLGFYLSPHPPSLLHSLPISHLVSIAILFRFPLTSQCFHLLVGLGGWIVTFMLRVRGASPSASGYSGTGFWAGQALGRASLGFVTERYGERICITIYLAICLALQLVFWLVPQYIVSAVAVAFLGFFLGPLFPGCVMVTAKLLPKHIHVSAIGFGMALGGTGGTVFPFIIGAIAASKGVKVLQPIILALIIVVAIIWLMFPRVKKRE